MAESMVVHTAQGPVRGYKDPEGVFAFYGIPYATAPKGPNKFKAPLPEPTWAGTFEAINRGIVCPQQKSPFKIQTDKMQEDCLIVNVYVPDDDGTKLPVLVQVHGGAYQFGYGDSITPNNFVEGQKVIVVNFNYRVGVYGFLCLGTPDIPGNAGMKDQVAALRWVKKNIASFGGDPNNISITGYSSGSHSVDLLMIAKSTKGLFNKVIAESGANLGPALVADPLRNAKEYAKALNFTNVDDLNALEKFYKDSSIEELTKGSVHETFDSSIPFGPCLELDSDDAFLTEDVAKILKKGNYTKVPMLYGFTTMEGLAKVGHFDEWKDKMNENFSDFLPGNLQFDNEKQKEEVAKKVKEFYFGDKPLGDDSLLSYIDYFSDVLFIYPMLRAVKMHVNNGHDHIYLYEYSFVSDDTKMPFFKNARGANHCAQTNAIFDGKNYLEKDESILSDELKTMKSIMRRMWGNFIKTGAPVPPGSELPAWPPVGANRSPHMALKLPPELRGEVLPRRARFWDEIYARHHRSLAPPV